MGARPGEGLPVHSCATSSLRYRLAPDSASEMVCASRRIDIQNRCPISWLFSTRRSYWICGSERALLTAVCDCAVQRHDRASLVVFSKQGSSLRIVVIERHIAVCSFRNITSQCVQVPRIATCASALQSRESEPSARRDSHHDVFLRAE